MLSWIKRLFGRSSDVAGSGDRGSSSDAATSTRAQAAKPDDYETRRHHEITAVLKATPFSQLPKSRSGGIGQEQVARYMHHAVLGDYLRKRGFTYDYYPPLHQQDSQATSLCNTLGNELVRIHKGLQPERQWFLADELSNSDTPTLIKQCGRRLHEVGGTLQMLYGIYAIMLPFLFSTSDTLNRYLPYKDYLSKCFDGIGRDEDRWRESCSEVIWVDEHESTMLNMILQQAR